MEQEIVYIAKWWFFLLFIGLSAFPVTWLLFKKFTDAGYGLAKIIGSLAISYVAFVAGTFHLLPFYKSSLALIIVLFITLNIGVFVKHRKKITGTLKKNIKTVVSQEILFTCGYIFWTLVRGYHPDIEGLEKFMDYGFINSILKTKYLPPPDMWFAGESVNYYWFGHLWTAVLTKITSIPASITYNLMIATILGFSLTAVFSIVSTLTKFFKANKKATYLAGIISAVLLVFAGNFHAPIYAFKNGSENYWYPDATRFIGYNPETNDKTIHEFPMYSFVVSDLHAHLLNLPFVLLYIAILLKVSGAAIKKGIGASNILLPGFVLGIMFMTNTWDFGNYALLTGIVYLFFAIKRGGVKLKNLFVTGLKLVGIVVFTLITASPFILNFESIAQGIDFVNAHTPIWQLGVLWGFPAVLTAAFAFALLKKRKKIGSPDLFILSLLCISWVLIFIPEIVYVKDIYIASHHRANTMFKLTYQAFVMFYLTSGYIIVRTVYAVKNKLSKVFLSLLFLFITASVMSYPYFAIGSFYRDLKDFRGVSGETWLADKYTDTYNTISWLRENEPGQPVILEAPGDSYTHFNAVSAHTGLPTISGWFVHEWLWRGDSKFPQQRVAEIVQIYTSDNPVLTKALLDKYKVKYVVVGKFEKEKYPNLNQEKFSEIGSKVFSSATTTLYKINQ